MHLAKAQQKIGNHIFAEKLAKKVISLSEATNTAMPTNTFISGVLEVLEDIYTKYRSTGDEENVKEKTSNLGDIHLSLQQ